MRVSSPTDCNAKEAAAASGAEGNGTAVGVGLSEEEVSGSSGPTSGIMTTTAAGGAGVGQLDDQKMDVEMMESAAAATAAVEVNAVPPGATAARNSARLRRIDDIDDFLTSADESELDPLQLKSAKEIEADAASGSNALEMDDDCDRWSKDFDCDSQSPTSSKRSSTIRCVVVGFLVLLMIAGVAAAALLFHRRLQGEPLYDFHFARYYASHMVLQRAPSRAVIWGYGPMIYTNTTVLLQLENDTGIVAEYRTTVKYSPSGTVWKVIMDPLTGGPYVITASLIGLPNVDSLQLVDVMFGDVWLCVGQNKLHYSIDKLLNATGDADMDHAYHDIRIFSLFPAKSDMLWYDLRGIHLPWSVPRSIVYSTNNTLLINAYFPSICWMFGKQLHSELHRPIGLISVTYTDSLIDEWMPSRVIDQCGVRFTDSSSRIWNGMVHPLLDLPIFGVIWHQGSHDMTEAPHNYSCMMTGLINYWRQTASDRTMNSTSHQFPVGVVQLSPEGDFDVSTHYSRYSLTSARWQQTANYGFLPNEVMPHTFLAVTIDLPDTISNLSTHASLHSRHKHDIVARLMLGALTVAYKRPGYIYQGPWPRGYSITSSGTSRVLTLHFGSTGIFIHKHTGYAGFEVCCSNSENQYCNSKYITGEREWVTAQIASASSTPTSIKLSLNTCDMTRFVVGVRYAWREIPCTAKQCPVYTSSMPRLPMAPFIRYNLTEDGKTYSLDPLPVELV